MNYTLQISKTITLPSWDDEVKQKIVRFWESRGIAFTQATDDTLKGHRGSWLGNLTSYDMSKLLADLTISRSNETQLFCVLDVNISCQDITEWNKAYWQLEMDTLESYLLYNDERENEWQEFSKNSLKAAWQWSLSFRLLGRKFPRKS